MIHDLSEALGKDYEMFYNASVPTYRLTPVQTVDSILISINQALFQQSTDIDQWPDHLKNDIAKLVRVNWIFQRLSQEPIRKPILAHPNGDTLVVDCGDTRLMSLSLLDRAVTVSVVITCKKGLEWSGWQKISSNQELIKATGFSQQSLILMTKSQDKDHALDWLEIGDSSTAHHLHDANKRLCMIKTWLEQAGPGFQFTRDWLKLAIDWASFSTKI